MTLLRRLIVALALMAGLPAFAQVPGASSPVPALPDTERRTSYSISGTTCACNVNFALYGDSTDVDSWLEVWIGGVRYLSTDPIFGWAITSPSGPIGSIARPITDAVLTFNAVQTGTVQIVGARRPRRVSQFNENQGVPARNLNQAITDIIATQRELWDKTNDVTGRAVLALPGETLAPLPAKANRLSQGACFDSNGNLVNCVSVPSSTFSAGSGIVFTGTNPTTVTVVLPSCTANTIMAGPATGPAASPSCRALVAADLPASLINQRVITAAGAVTVGATDDQILVNKTVPATTTVNLPAASTRNARVLVVKDFAGIAAAFAITIVPNGGETIDGAATLVISTNRQSYTLVPISGTGWAII